MTPEEHIERAEWLLAFNNTEGSGDEDLTKNRRVKTAEVHVRIAEFKKKYPPESGRPLRSGVDKKSCPTVGCPSVAGHGDDCNVPVRSSGRMHNHMYPKHCTTMCPAFGTDSTNYPRPVADNPQA